MKTNEHGDVILELGFNTKSAKQSINDLGKAINGVFNAFKGKTVSSPQLDRLNAQAEQSNQKIKRLSEEIREMSETEVKTSAAKDLSKQYDALFDKFGEIKQRYEGLGRDFTHVKSWDDLPAQLRDVGKKMVEIQARYEDLKKSGKAFTTAAHLNPEAFAKLNDELRKEQSNFAGIQAEIDRISMSGEKSSNNVGKVFKKMANSVISAFRKIKSHAKNTSSSAADSFGNINGAVKKGIKTLVKYGLGMRSLFVLFRKIRSAVVESYKDLAAYSDEVNQSVSDTKSAITKLKNSLGAMVQPLVTAFAPVITAIANKLTGVAESVGQFFAALTGQDYVYKALDVQESYADSLKDTADNATKATKALDAYLSPLDDINRYTANTGETDAGTDADKSTAKFTKSKIGNSFKEFADKVKGYFSDLFQPIKSAWAKYGKPVMEEWRLFLDNVKGLIFDVGRAFRNVWLNGTGERVTENILHLWKSILSVVNGLLSTLRDAWNKDALGESVIQSFLDRFSSLITFIRTVADTFKEVWTDGTGERIWTNILTIVRNINNIIGGFWGALTRAWLVNDNGKRIWEGILGVIEDTSGWLKDLSGLTFEWIDDLDLAPALTAVAGLLEAFRKLNSVLLEKFKGAYENVLLPFGKWTIEKAVPALIDLLSGALKLLSSVLKVIPLPVLTGVAAGITAIFVALKAYKMVKEAWERIKGLGVAFETLGKKIGAFVSSNPYVAAFLAIAAAIAAVVTAIKVYNTQKWNNSELKKYVDELSEKTEKVQEAADNINSSISSINNTAIEVKADVSKVETLRDRLKEVIKDGVIDEKEMPEYQTVMGLLQEIDGFQEMWEGIELKEIDGKIYIDTDEATKKLDQFVNDWKRTQWMTALQGMWSQATADKIKNSIDIEQQKADTDTLGQLYLAEVRKYNNGKLYDTEQAYLDTVYGGVNEALSAFPGAPQALKDTAQAYYDARKALEDYQTASSANEQIIEYTDKILQNLNGNMSDYSGLIYAVQQGWMSEADAVAIVNDKNIKSFDDLVKATSNSAASVKTSASAMLTSIGESTALGIKSIGEAFSGIESKAKTTAENSSSFFGGMAQSIIDAVERVNGLKIVLSGAFAGASIASSIKIPALAQGAVLPPNQPFAAILSDQRSGRNIETPEALMRQIVREETGSSGGNTYTIPIQIGAKTLITAVIDEARLQQNEIGYNPLVTLGG